MTTHAREKPATLDPAKFRDPRLTAKGERRASVALAGLKTLWFNTGTLCNLTCGNCYIESSPVNDRLVYLTATEVAAYLDEIAALGLATEEIGITGGEPFMNPEIIAILEEALARGFRVLVLTNAMRPMMKHASALAALNARLGARLAIRVSIDHYGPALHELERGARSWKPTIEGLQWLARNGFTVYVAGRTAWGEAEESLRRGYGRLFAELGVAIDAEDPAELVLFPEMDAGLDVPEITEACWGILDVSPDAMMCASSRMVVKRKGAAAPAVVPCTLLPYDTQFEMGARLADARAPVALNHPHCARFCVLGGGACSKG
ncbi:MAG: radical SAM protein [Alphaproteobacteria bacterium]|nr:radical SAM protein [Alphaproteobacteria bacterium]